jgi:hypothetical protein
MMFLENSCRMNDRAIVIQRRERIESIAQQPRT